LAALIDRSTKPPKEVGIETEILALLPSRWMLLDVQRESNDPCSLRLSQSHCSRCDVRSRSKPLPRSTPLQLSFRRQIVKEQNTRSYPSGCAKKSPLLVVPAAGLSLSNR